MMVALFVMSCVAMAMAVVWFWMEITYFIRETKYMKRKEKELNEKIKEINKEIAKWEAELYFDRDKKLSKFTIQMIDNLEDIKKELKHEIRIMKEEE